MKMFFAYRFIWCHFYNIEKLFSSTRTRLGIYETKTFAKVATLFEEDEKLELDYSEIVEVNYENRTHCFICK